MGKNKRRKGWGTGGGENGGFFFPFCLFAAPPLPFLCLPRWLGVKQENNGVIYGNLAALSNLALTG